jgi:hypothetical protein
MRKRYDLHKTASVTDFPMVVHMNKEIALPGGLSLEDKVKEINTRQDFVSFVQSLREDFLRNGDNWENQQLPNYLAAMAGWVEDMDGYYQNLGQVMPEQPNWSMLAQILLASRIYE